MSTASVADALSTRPLISQFVAVSCRGPVIAKEQYRTTFTESIMDNLVLVSQSLNLEC